MLPPFLTIVAARMRKNREWASGLGGREMFRRALRVTFARPALRNFWEQRRASQSWRRSPPGAPWPVHCGLGSPAETHQPCGSLSHVRPAKTTTTTISLPVLLFRNRAFFSDCEAADSAGLLTSSPDRLTPRKQPCPNATRHPQARYGCSSPSTPLPPLPPR